jgi:hypothetical protein
MAVDPRLKALSGTSRRDFFRWVTAASVAVGLDRAGLLNFLNDNGGTAMADTLAASKVMRSFWLRAGTGGFANFQLLWPHVEVAKAGNAAFAFPWAANQVADAATDRPSVTHPGSPFAGMPKSKQVTAMMWSQNQTHTNVPTGDAAAGISTIAAMAAIQQAEPTLLPVIAVTPFNFGTAPGAPAAATVADPDGLIDLFNSAASRALLQSPENAALHEAYYKAFLGLNAAAGRTSLLKSYGTGKVAANLLGQNLAAKLRPTAADLTALGVTAQTPGTISAIAKTFIIGLKAMQLGLTSMVYQSVFRDDPHGLFAGGDTAPQNKAMQTKAAFDGMMKLAASMPSPTGNKTLGDEIMFVVDGDTPKQPTIRAGWPDGTPGNSNWIYVMSNGYLKTGWFGGVKANATAVGWDPQTGADVPGKTSAACTQDAAAAVLYAVAKGDSRRVQDFARFNLSDKIVNPIQL